MSALGIIVSYSNVFPQGFGIKLMPMIYFSLTISIIFFGFAAFKDKKLISITLENIRLYKRLEFLLLFGSIFCILFFIPVAYNSFKGDIDENRTNIVFSDVDDLGERFGGWGILNSFASLIGNFFILTQMFFFLNLIPINGKIRITKAVIMLIASMSYIVYILAYVGRDGTVFWAMSFIFQYIFFKNFIEKKVRLMIRKYIFILLGLIAIPFILITISRYKDLPIPIYWGIINYMGGQIPNFNDHYLVNGPLQHGQFHFPVFVDMVRSIGFYIKPAMEKNEMYSYFLDKNVFPWVFTTFIGGFIIDFGKMGTLILVAVFFFFIRKLVKKSMCTGTFSLSGYILFILYYQMVFFGVFYFRLYSANYYMIAMILLHLIFKLLKGKNMVLTKIN
jgi:oligosaccharide repeat unit polymerase